VVLQIFFKNKSVAVPELETLVLDKSCLASTGKLSSYFSLLLMCKSGHDLYERIYYPVDLPAITDLEETDCRYPVLFEPNRGRPKKEVRLTKPNASIQKCSRCNLSGVCLLSYLFLSLF
jgi:hypothetical protein